MQKTVVILNTFYSMGFISFLIRHVSIIFLFCLQSWSDIFRIRLRLVLDRNLRVNLCRYLIYLCQILIIFSRQLESLIRLAEAHARLRFSHNVEVVDVEEATRLHREALKQSAIDPSTGNLLLLLGNLFESH